MGLKILMLGWELPPFNSGGLGEACLGLVQALVKKGADITFVLPRKVNVKANGFKVVFADVDEDLLSTTNVYTTSSEWSMLFHNHPMPPDFVLGALKFGERVRELAKKYNADLIHAHDWLTFPGGIAAKSVLKKPLVTHVHSTEFDRTSGHFPNPTIVSIEKKGLEYADKVISVSNFTKKMLTHNYGINPEKIEVVHNGVMSNNRKYLAPALSTFKDLGYKVVLYLGRITLQKGPEYFVRAAKKVLEYEEKTIFVVVGSGDMQEAMIAEAGYSGILDKMIFTGFLRGEEKDRLYQAADLYVMPSVSEPFGITPLESIANGTPVLVSKQSGVSEVIEHSLKVDFWDTDEMANKIIAVLEHKSLKNVLIDESSKELKGINWEKAAEKCFSVYNQLIY